MRGEILGWYFHLCGGHHFPLSAREFNDGAGLVALGSINRGSILVQKGGKVIAYDIFAWDWSYGDCCHSTQLDFGIRLRVHTGVAYAFLIPLSHLLAEYTIFISSSFMRFANLFVVMPPLGSYHKSGCALPDTGASDLEVLSWVYKRQSTRPTPYHELELQNRGTLQRRSGTGSRM
jgi:hypothetical protein